MLFKNKFLRILSLGPPTGSKPFAGAVWQLLSWFIRKLAGQKSFYTGQCEFCGRWC